ncbi:hypothetical protein D3C72_788310 [compost metagenome]
MRHFAGLLRQGFIVVGARGERVERQIELVFPAEFKAGFRHGVIADLRARVAFG